VYGSQLGAQGVVGSIPLESEEDAGPSLRDGTPPRRGRERVALGRSERLSRTFLGPFPTNFPLWTPMTVSGRATMFFTLSGPIHVKFQEMDADTGLVVHGLSPVVTGERMGVITLSCRGEFRWGEPVEEGTSATRLYEVVESGRATHPRRKATTAAPSRGGASDAIAALFHATRRD
jgi:hypothetical protein